MKASVIIPTKNPPVVFSQVLEMVLAQDCPWDFEVLVIDSGSSPEVIDLIRGYHRIRLHRIKPEEFGHGRTRNLGLAMTAGQFAAMLTQDALPVDEHWLRHLVEACDQAPDIAGAFGRHLAYPTASLFLARELEALFTNLSHNPPLSRMDDRERYSRDQGYRQYLHFFSDNNSCLRRAVWEKIPYPDVDFAEDQIWAQKIIEAGYTKAYAHQAAVYHSHDFDPWERLQRSFDESYAFLRFFGYRQGQSLARLLYHWLRLNYSDLKFAWDSGMLPGRLKELGRQPLVNFMRLAGAWLGSRGPNLPDWVVDRLSFDRRLTRSGSK